MPHNPPDVPVYGSASASESPAGSPDGKPSTGEGKGKKTQRPSWSCTECTRRKIRCDKLVPCGACTKRGKASTCHLSAPEPHIATRDPLQNASGESRLATSTEFEAIRQSVTAIRQRLYHLETVLSQFVPQLDQTGPDGGPMYAYPSNGHGRTVMKVERDGPEEGFGDNGEGLSRGLRTTLGDVGPLASTSYAISTSVDRIREEGTTAESDGEVEAAVTLEFLALGRDRKQDHFSRSALRRPEADDDEIQTSPVNTSWPLGPSSLFPAPGTLSMDPSHISPFSTPNLFAVLPDRETSDRVVQYSLDRVGWQHGAVHAGNFKAECEEFFGWGTRRGELVNQAWLALYYAILCVGTKHMSPQDRIECGLVSDAGLPKAFFDASVDALHRGNFLAKHSIYSVQAIVILVMTCQDVGGSDLIATLLSCGIRISQHLNIHRFTSDADWEARRRQSGDQFSPEGIKSLIDREVRKRLWCALTTEDWVSIPYRRSYAIFPSHFSTPLPTNCRDEDLAEGNLIVRPLEEPTISTKLILSIRVASCIRRFFEDVNSLGGLSYDLCLQIDREIREIIRTCPSYLHPDTDIRHLPSFVASFRNYWIMSVQHKLLVIHRTFLGRSFRDPRYAYSRKAAIEAARGIIARFLMGSHLPQHVWTAIYHAISASTILILDVFQSSASDPSDDITNKRQEVTSTLEELRRLEDSSPIAARGAALLGTLLAEEAKHRRPGGGGVDPHALHNNKKRKPMDDEGSGRFGEVAKRVATGSSSSNGGGGLSPTTASTPFPYYAPQQGSPGNSDGSLTNEAYDQILFNGLGAQIGASPGAMDSNSNAFDFWRMLDASFEPAQDGAPDVGLGLGGNGNGMSPFPQWQ